jgi:asparagine synthase (glutamine-hydrolysing)
MPDPRIDESFAAQAAASAIGSEHTTLDCEPNPAEDLQRMIAQLGLPFGDSSLLPTYWVSKAVRSVSKVALTGDGGDELFCGYDRQVAARRFLHWMPLIRRIPRALFTDRDPRGFGSRARRLISAARHGYREFLAIYQLPDLERLLPDLGFAWYNLNPFADLDPAAVDFWEYLRNDLMVKSDTASMSVALEVRSPMLSTSLVRACLSAPYEDLMPHGQRKGLLRAVARRYLPAEVVDRPKQGFAIPIGDWFRSDFGGMKTLLMDHLNSAEPWPNIKIDLNRQFVQQMVDEHMNLRRDHSQRLYMLLVLSIWAKAVLA